jgi:SH3 domain-containing YSC84-like protein 1
MSDVCFSGTMKMKGLITGLIAIGLTLGTVGNLFADAKEEINEATNTLKNFSSMPEREIPPAVLKNAKGFAIFHVIDVALLANGKGGPGIVVAKTTNGWSGPVFVGLGGAGVGAQIGGKVKELVLVLNSDKAVESLSHGNVKLGADLSARAGPAGASAEAETAFTNTDMFSYAESNGVFAGASLEGSVIAPRDDMNNKFYGKEVTPNQILSGQIQPPGSATPLMTLLRSLGSTGMVSQASKTGTSGGRR